MQHIAPKASGSRTSRLPISALIPGMMPVILAFLGVDALRLDRQPVGLAMNSVASTAGRSGSVTLLAANAPNSSKTRTQGKFDHVACATGGCPGKNVSTKSNEMQAQMQVTSLVNSATQNGMGKQTPTFQSYYWQHSGRGMWKWSPALDAYQMHFSQFAGRASKMLEIGVQSGGSINMYRAILPQTHYYGMDINKNCVQFSDEQTTIYLGDQASVPAWNHFFSAVTPKLDICIDDGGHQAHQMLTTLQQVLPHMNPGGFFLTEDIHGVNDDYLQKFFNPAAPAIAGTTALQSVHLYPFILGLQIGGLQGPTYLQATASVSDIPSVLTALPQNLGGIICLMNPNWGSFLTTDALLNFFATFYDLNGGVVREDPPHCHNLQNTSRCVMIATNTHLQNLVKGVHIFQDRLFVEVHASPPSITAHRKGSVWIPYNGP